ncbi:MAG TPA: lipid-binding SYLF domain-containing protein [Blastocatellia bacterium]|nr:lipid-binding SYLF domain-containing protein [Blastocatellia bacterium]
MKLSFTTFLVALLITASATAGAQNERADELKRLARATEVFQEIMRTPDKGIPGDLLDKAECVAIVPGMKKGGLGIGGRYGKGVVMCRQSNRSWSAPSFLTVEGGSIGLQIGFQQIDLVMLVMNREGMEKLVGDKFTVGADASAAAGPVGRQASAETNIRMDAQILTYSRAKGLFAGVTLNGAVVKQDRDDNRDFYGKEMDARAILFQGTVPMPPEARPLASALSWKSPRKK